MQINYTLDCCNLVVDGTAEYKGKYTFSKVLAGVTSTQNCTYTNNFTFLNRAFATCVPNLETGPSYNSLNATFCPAKYNTTNILEKINEVKIL